MMTYLPKNSMSFHCSTQSTNYWLYASLLSFLFLYILCVCVGHFFFWLPPLWFQNTVQCYECSQTLKFQYVSFGSCTKFSDVQVYTLIFFTDFLLIFPYCSLCQHFFVITRNQYQCDKTQNCIKCLAPHISYSHPAVCSLKCWKQPTFILSNMQINGCL
jgi:hypothetical protein